MAHIAKSQVVERTVALLEQVWKSEVVLADTLSQYRDGGQSGDGELEQALQKEFDEVGALLDGAALAACVTVSDLCDTVWESIPRENKAMPIAPEEAMSRTQEMLTALFGPPDIVDDELLREPTPKGLGLGDRDMELLREPIKKAFMDVCIHDVIGLDLLSAKSVSALFAKIWDHIPDANKA